MSLVSIPALAIASLIALQSMPIATAQPGDDRTRSLHSAALNELGILEYCHALGLIGESAVSAQRNMIRRLAGAEAVGVAGSAEREAGRAGFLAFDGRQGRFEESAAAQGVTLKTACETRAAVAPLSTR